jgi:hypothetical protein
MKLKRRSVTLVSLSIALLCAAFGIQATRVMALQTWTVGVHIGDWAEYSFVAEGNLTGFSSTNIPESGNVTVTGISGTNITCQSWYSLTNGTQETDTGSVDVESGSGNMTGGVIAADLNEGDLVYNGSWSSSSSSWSFTGATINETVTRNYLGSSVTTNHLNVTEQSDGIYMSMDCFWFRDSGVLAEVVFNYTLVESGAYMWAYVDEIITGASVDVVPEFSVSLILPLFVALSTLAVVSAKKRFVKK